MSAYQLDQFVDLLAVPGGGERLELEGTRLIASESGRAFDSLAGVPQLLDAPYDQDVEELYEGNVASDMTEHATVGYRSALQYRQIASGFNRFFADFDAGAVVADIGCGHGRLVQGLAERLPVFGIDLSNRMLSQAAKSGLIPLRASAERLPFRDDVLDGVVSAEVIQHIPDLPELFAEFARVVRPGGVVVISTLNRDSIVRRLNRRLKGMTYTDKARLRDAREVIAATQSLDLKLRAIRWIFSPLPVGLSAQRSDSNWRWFAQNFILCLQRT